MFANKKLGQHWLTHKPTLEKIASYADLNKKDTVLEIGPGYGSLTEILTSLAGSVVAVEVDISLAVNLPQRVKVDNLQVHHGDILKFDLSQLPAGYKVVASIPYYLTSNLIRVLSESSNPPAQMILLVQEEVAQRIAAQPGQMGILSISTQLHYLPKLGTEVKAQLFNPPPKVDSQVIILSRRSAPLFKDLDEKIYLRIVKAGFSGRRKKLRSSLAAGLLISKAQADQLLKVAAIDGDLRAQNISLEDWFRLYKSYENDNIKT